MGTSSLLGTQGAPVNAPGSDAEALGPSDSSDSGSDMVGTEATDDEVFEPRARPADGADVSVDRVEEADTEASAAEDPDLSFMDEAEAPDPLEDEGEDEDARAGDDPTDNEMSKPRAPATVAKRQTRRKR